MIPVVYLVGRNILLKYLKKKKMETAVLYILFNVVISLDGAYSVKDITTLNSIYKTPVSIFCIFCIF